MFYATLMATLILASFARSLAAKVWSKDYKSGYARIHKISALTKTFFNFSGAAILFSLVSLHSLFTGEIVITELLNPVLLSLGFLMGGCLAAGWFCFFIGNEASITSSIFQNATIPFLIIILPGAERLLGIRDDTGPFSYLGLALIIGGLCHLWMTNQRMDAKFQEISATDEPMVVKLEKFKTGAIWMSLSGIVISIYPVGIKYGLQVLQLDGTLLMNHILFSAASITFIIGRRRGEFAPGSGLIRRNIPLCLILGLMTFTIFQVEAVLFASSLSVAVIIAAKRGSCLLDMVTGVVIFNEPGRGNRARLIAHGMFAAILVIAGILIAFHQ